MRSVVSRVMLAASLGIVALPAYAQTKTAKECDAEYSANKTAIKGAGQKKKDFVTACKAGTETIPGGGAAAASASAPAPAPAPAPPATTAAPAPTSAPVPAPTASRKTARPVAPTATGTMGANQFSTEAQASARCPGQTVVWVNTKSGVYHFAGTKNYGTTKAGGYMCEADATAAGDHASKEEKHP